MNLLGAILVVVFFAVLLHLVGLVERTRSVIAIASQALATLRDSALSDDEKEKAMQQNTLRMFALLFVLIAGTALALLLPIVVIWLLQFAGVFSLDGVLAMLMRWDFIVGGTLLGIATYFASAKWLKTSS